MRTDEGHKSTPRTDIQAILTNLGHSPPPEAKGFRDVGRLFDLSNTDLRGAEFGDAHLEYTNFFGAHLDGAKFGNAHLEHTNFDYAHLEGAVFWDADREYKNFFGAHLDGATLWGAVLSHAKLDHAYLVGANLRAAKLDGASLENANVTGAIYDGDTTWPDGFDYVGGGAVRIDERA